MDFAIIIQIILIGISLSMDAFAVSVTDGLIYTDINKKKSIFIALTFGIFQALMPLIGYWVIELVTVIVGSAGGDNVANVLSKCVTYLAVVLLLFIGGKMIFDAIKEMKKPLENRQMKKFSFKEVLLFGVATSIDALATGVALHGGTLSTNQTVFLHVAIIFACTFIICIFGVFLGHFFEKLFKGRFEITGIIGGSILLLLAVFIFISGIIL